VILPEPDTNELSRRCRERARRYGMRSHRRARVLSCITYERWHRTRTCTVSPSDCPKRWHSDDLRYCSMHHIISSHITLDNLAALNRALGFSLTTNRADSTDPFFLRPPSTLTFFCFILLFSPLSLFAKFLRILGLVINGSLFRLRD
jgi:hypothetical protein